MVVVGRSGSARSSRRPPRAVIVAFLVLLLASLGFFGSLGPALAIAVGVMLITVAHPDPGDRVAARPVRLLAVEGVAAPAEGHHLAPARHARSAAGRRWSRSSPAACWSSSRRGASGYKADYDFSAGFPQDTESARAAADLQRGFAGRGARPDRGRTCSRPTASPLDRRAVRRRSPPAAGATAPGVGQARQPELEHRPRRRADQPAAQREPGVQRGDRRWSRGDLRDAAARRRPPGTKALVGGHDGDLRRHQHAPTTATCR